MPTRCNLGAIHPGADRAQRVRQVCRSMYNSEPSNLASSELVCLWRTRVASAMALACCFLRLYGSSPDAAGLPLEEQTDGETLGGRSHVSHSPAIAMRSTQTQAWE
jgi:hypothetical protein